MVNYWFDSIDENGYYKYLYKIVGLDKVGFLIIDPKTYKLIDHNDISDSFLADGAINSYRSILANRDNGLPKKGTAQWY